MNASGNGYQMIYFPETIIQWDTIPVMVILYNCCTRHNNTHSVHKRLLKLWRVRLLFQWPCCYVPPPLLSGANCRPFPLSGGPGPPVSKMAPFSLGSTHTPSPLSATTTTSILNMNSITKMTMLSWSQNWNFFKDSSLSSTCSFEFC
jgi:hypothetical protein